MPSRPLFIFDLDNTLYPPDVILWRIVDARIERYVQEKLRVDAAEARSIRREFLRDFGTTLRGLMHHHAVDPAEYLEYVHDVPIPDVVPPRPELGAMLETLPGRRVVFTNGSESYARRVIDALGVSGLMDGIFGIEFMDYIAKPSPYPYAKLLQATGAGAEDSLFCEDRFENLMPAHAMGMFTVWVGGREDDVPRGREGAPPPAHAVVPDVCDLPRVLPGFLAGRRPGAAPGTGGKDNGGNR